MDVTITFRDLSTNNDFPKTLEIRNEHGGLIWQIYHVNNIDEAIILSNVATKNGFDDISLVDYDNTHEDTFENWRNTDSWKEMWKDKEQYKNFK